MIADRARASASHCVLAVLGIGIGTISLLPDSTLMDGERSKAIIHALFGLLLCGLVLARFRWWLHRCGEVQALEIRRFSRQLSRTIYVILYLCIGTQQIIRIIGYLQSGHDSAHGIGSLGSPVNGQALLLGGMIALVLIRVLAFISGRWLDRPLPSANLQNDARARYG